MPTSVDLRLGDCLELIRSLPDKSIDLIVTDPPYGHNNNDGEDLIRVWERALSKGKPGDTRPIANDGYDEANELVKQLFREAARLLKPGCCCCCCCGGGGGPDPQFARWALWMDEPLEFKQMVIWDKGKMGMGWHYRRSYETVLVAQKRGGKCRWFDTSHKVENIIRPGDYGIKKIIPTKDQHPTQKPVELFEHFIKLHTQEGDTVLDPFMGSGSSGVAAINTGRNFIGMELDPTYFEMAQKRLEAVQEPLCYV